MKPMREMSEAELAAYISQHLLGHGIHVLLSGGTCVTIYSGRTYVSGDLDLVLEGLVSMSKVEAALAEIGFVRADRVFRHPDASLMVDIRPPPPAVGGEPVKQIIEMQLSTGTLRVLSATDCVKDRLAGYYFFNDARCLAQACLVAGCRRDVDLAEVERWSEHEGQGQKFAAIKGRLSQAASKPLE